MMVDELHDDWRDVDTVDHVCMNHDCEHYHKPVEVPVRMGTFESLDSRDVDCQCGAQLIPVDLEPLAVGLEEIEPAMIRRYREVGVWV